MPRDTLTDTESFPNFWCAVFKHADLPEMGVFEVSERRNDAAALAAFYPTLERVAGFNIIGYDYHLVHHLVHAVRTGAAAGLSGLELAGQLYRLSQEVLARDGPDRMQIWERDWLVPMLDLYRVHHFDNRARTTSLKALEFAMRSESIVESPVPFGTWLSPAQMDKVIAYCCSDVGETGRFLERSGREVAFREELDAELGGRSWLNLSDASVGKRFFRDELERANPGCTKRKTPRGEIRLADVIFPYISFRHEPFARKLTMLREASVSGTDLKSTSFGTAVHRGFALDFGSGGLHGSVRHRRVEATAERAILDIDVTSYYPMLAIVNGIYPAHLGPEFVRIYARLFEMRRATTKGSAKNLMLKLALNAVFGDSNNPYGPFYDPAYTLSITINGQLLLCMLIEAVTDVPSVELVQANTDGLTLCVDRSRLPEIEAACRWWEAGTALSLERQEYSGMWVRDVNNYLAQPADPSRPPKRKGAYEYELDWWQDPSALAVPMAAEAAMLRGEDPAAWLARRAAEQPWDFMLRTKVPRTSRLYWGGEGAGWEEVQRVSRYYVGDAGRGRRLVKVMPPLPGRDAEREIAVQKGRAVEVRNVYRGEPLAGLDLGWYAAEARKLIIN